MTQTYGSLLYDLEKVLNVLTPNKEKTYDNPTVYRGFVLKHTFKNVSDMKKESFQLSKVEEHIGVPWSISACRRVNDDFSMYLRCDFSEKRKWSISTDFDIQVVHPNGRMQSGNRKNVYNKNAGKGFHEFMRWSHLKQNYLVNDELKVEVHVKILKMTGVYKPDLRIFNDTQCSDVVLIVQDKKFHVLKLYLASHSSYFKSMFLGKFSESKRSEITLTGIEADDFQKYLEVLYAECAIDEYTVEGILSVADMYDTPLVMRKCEKFLRKTSKKDLKKKFQLAARYDMKKLTKKCLTEIETMDDIRSVTPADVDDMDASLISILFKKSLTLK